VAEDLAAILRKARIEDLDLGTPCKVSRETSLREAHRLLDERHTGALVVCDEERVVGIFTDRDVLYRTALEGPDPDTPLAELMTREPTTLSPEAPLSEAVEAMTRGGLRHIPLVAGERFEGVISSRDVLKFIAAHFPESVLNLPPRLNQTLRRPEGG